jgi:tetratricopeptide (TPR) repeat protein
MTRALVFAALAGLAGSPTSAAAVPSVGQPISLRDSFPIGSAGQIVCTAQSSALDRAFADMFDRGYAITCRDAAAPVGNLYVLRAGRDDPAERLARLRADRVDCSAAPAPSQIAELGAVQRIDCRLKNGDVGYRIYLLRRAGRLYAAEGLAGYDGALQIGLRTLVANRPVAGEISVATTGAGDPVAFARAQAGTLDPRRALEEAYRRNNGGEYAESGEFFGTLSSIEERATRAEALVNQGLQASNLGEYQEAEGLFARAAALSNGDPVLGRRLRNYTALHLLNQGEPAAALTELDRVVEEDRSPGTNAAPIIDRPLADRLSAEAPGRTTLDAASNTLTRAEKVQILDAQAMQLRGTVLRLQRRPDAAAPLLRQAFDQLQSVRGGVVASTIWMRAQILAELAAIAESQRQPAEAERLYRQSVALLETDYPGSSALLSARARLAAYLARSGQADQALTLYHAIVAENVQSGSGSAIVRRALEPYFALLTRGAAAAGQAADIFLAAQVVTRPGVAQTQAVLARELSGGSDEASRLFRQSVALTRDVERTRVDIARLQAMAQNSQAAAMLGDLRTRLTDYEQAQTATQARLAVYPRFRVVAPGGLPLGELQALLRPGEAYYKMIVLNGSTYAVLATQGSARAVRLDATPLDLTEKVDIIRATISLYQDGELLTYPFDIETARSLYVTLFGPFAGELASVRHLIFEPDGPMLRLPPNLLVEDDASVARYRTRSSRAGGDAYDFTGTAWFGRNRDISTAVGPRAFRDVRAAAPSRASRNYLGFGQNAPVTVAGPATASRGGADMDADCAWSLATWDHPVPAEELLAARAALAQVTGAADVVTGQQFSDSAILARADLDQYRVMHFATHGLVTPPRQGCPARPALLTSFGGGGSDGLLSFREIFDLHLDADLIILSACDTASSADPTAAEEAGLRGGGDYSFDGLVRAFVGAGGRLVLASHWQLPEVYHATERLVGGLFTSPPGTGTAAALAAAERRLMDEPATSHPYYWAGFAVVGDGSVPVVRANVVRSASAH